MGVRISEGYDYRLGMMVLWCFGLEVVDHQNTTLILDRLGYITCMMVSACR